MRTDLMRVTVQVPEKDAVLVKQAADKEINGVPMGEGTPAVVRLPALPGRDFPGTVTRDSWSLDEAVRTLRTEIFLKNTTGELHVNMYADVVITTRIPNTLSLPSAAVLTDGNHDYCFEVKDGKAVRTIIQVGMRNDHWVQVLHKWQESTTNSDTGEWVNFTGNEAIVNTNPTALIDGQSVRVVEAAAPAPR